MATQRPSVDPSLNHGKPMLSERADPPRSATGGCIEVYGYGGEPAPAEFRVTVVDQTVTFLNDDDGGAPLKRDSGWLPSWSAALMWLSRYPWPHLAGLHVDPSVADDVWAALQDYIARDGPPIRDSALERWRKVCNQADR